MDLGTTILAVHLCNLDKGEVVASTALKSSQAVYGDDVMGRITPITENSDNLAKLHDLVTRSGHGSV